MNEKIYRCVCGKEFTTPNSFNGHKSACKQHHIEKYGNLEFYNDRYAKSTTKSTNTQREINKQKQQEKLSQWVSEQHTCEKCGKVMTEKFGSGRFCSRACANSRERSDEVKHKISQGVITTGHTPHTREKFLKVGADNHARALEKYYKNPSICECCGNIIEYDKKHRKTCSESCYNQIAGGLRAGSGTGKHGWYKNFYCDSSYELAFVIYKLDHGCKIERNKRFYEYVGTDGKLHKYYPDFIENDFLVEVKGYLTDDVFLKIAAVDDKPVKLLMLDDLKPMFDYIKETYKCTDITTLYES